MISRHQAGEPWERTGFHPVPACLSSVKRNLAKGSDSIFLPIKNNTELH